HSERFRSLFLFRNGYRSIQRIGRQYNRLFDLVASRFFCPLGAAGELGGPTITLPLRQFGNRRCCHIYYSFPCGTSWGGGPVRSGISRRARRFADRRGAGGETRGSWRTDGSSPLGDQTSLGVDTEFLRGAPGIRGTEC